MCDIYERINENIAGAYRELSDMKHAMNANALDTSIRRVIEFVMQINADRREILSCRTKSSK